MYSVSIDGTYYVLHAGDTDSSDNHSTALSGHDRESSEADGKKIKSLLRVHISWVFESHAGIYASRSLYRSWHSTAGVEFLHM